MCSRSGHLDYFGFTPQLIFASYLYKHLSHHISPIVSDCFHIQYVQVLWLSFQASSDLTILNGCTQHALAHVC